MRRHPALLTLLALGLLVPLVSPASNSQLLCILGALKTQFARADKGLTPEHLALGLRSQGIPEDKVKAFVAEFSGSSTRCH